MNDILSFALGAAVFVALFIYGLRSGRMPMRVGHADRHKNPVMFKIAGCLVLGLISLFAFATVVALLRQ